MKLNHYIVILAVPLTAIMVILGIELLLTA